MIFIELRNPHAKVSKNVTFRFKDLPDIIAISSRKRKKTISLTVKRSGHVFVRFPSGLDLKEVEQFIHSKKTWLRQKLEASRQKDPAPAPGFFEGKPVPFLGEHFHLRLAPDENKARNVAFTGKEFILPEKLKDTGRSLFVSWYKEAAKDILTKTVRRFSETLKASPADIKVSLARKRWGSCSAGNTLNFSWRIAMLPQDIIDYIVVHEMAHLKQKNHGPLFWKTVASAIHDYKLRNEWLKDNSLHYMI
ncbi:MAG: SprT family zinc-dependent metalloprotease [Candidatus Omnitrophota bacterium]